MSDLTVADRHHLENLLGMGSGHVSGFTNRTFQAFVFESTGLDIDQLEYYENGESKAKRLRAFWKIESNYTVAKLLEALFDHLEDVYYVTYTEPAQAKLLAKCRLIAGRLQSSGPNLSPLKEHARDMDANHLAEQIQRMQAAVETDPSLAIGTAKELIETTCKTILAERGKEIPGSSYISTLTKATLKELKLVPEGVQESARGGDVIKRILSNLGSIGNGLAELRGLYGTGHGQHGKTTSLGARHARLAVGAAATLATFLFETHKEKNM